MKSGKVDCEADKQFCRELSIRSYPTVVLYTSPYQRHEITTQVVSEIIREVDSIISRTMHDEL